MLYLFLVFLSGTAALGGAAAFGAAISKRNVSAVIPAVVFIIFFVFIFSFAIDGYYNPSLLGNSSGRVVASYPSFAETPQNLRERGIQNYVFIVKGRNKYEYKITSNDLVDKNAVLKPGDLVTKTRYGVQKLKEQTTISSP